RQGRRLAYPGCRVAVQTRSYGVLRLTRKSPNQPKPEAKSQAAAGSGTRLTVGAATSPVDPLPRPMSVAEYNPPPLALLPLPLGTFWTKLAAVRGDWAVRRKLSVPE